jgi:ribonuclease HII
MPFGVDEAGKGPVLGSMFAAAVVGDPDALPEGVTDSKQLAPERREALAQELRSDPAFEIGLGEVTVEEIDDPETDMNQLTVDAQVRALADAGASGIEGHVDAGDVNAARFGRRVEAGVDATLTVTAEHEADERYPLVAAASVVAKVQRDAHVDELGANYDRPIGSGYPGDDRTRDFLAAYVDEHGDLPDCARRSWKTSRDVLEKRSQRSLGEF